MANDPNDKWSYGASADPAVTSGPGGRVTPADAEVRGADLDHSDLDPQDLNHQDLNHQDLNHQDFALPASDGAPIARAENGRWTSPSLGAYDTANGANPLDASFSGSDDVDDGQYFDEYGYGDDYGDGSFDDEFDEDLIAAQSDARRNAIEWAVVIVGAVLLALILRAVLLQAFWIPSPSMESTLLVKDRVLVNKVSYRLHDIHRGDVVVFRRTDAEIARNPELPRDVIKRVIALEGETIAINDNLVTIDGIALQEGYLDEGVFTSDFDAMVVPDGHVFVMGDNRELSLDSRFETGPISHDRVVGRAFFLFWPLGRMGAL